MTEEETRSGPADAAPTGPGQALRKRAEEIAREKAARMPENMEALSPERARQVLHELQVHQIELEMQNEELRGTQAELEASRARYFDLYDMAPVGYLAVGEQGLILEANLTAATLLGVARGALVKRPLSRFILPEDQDIYYRYRKALFETGAPQVCEMRLVREDGAPFWARLEATAAQNADGAPVCRAVMSDVTERKRAEEALQHAHDVLERRVAERTEELRRANEELRADIAERERAEEALKESETKFRAIFDNARDGMFLLDPETRRFVLCNGSCSRLLGYSEEELKAMQISDLHSIEDLPFIVSQIDRFLRGEEGVRQDMRFKCKDGSVVFADINPAAVRVGGRRSVLLALRDVTERKQAEEALRESEERYRELFENINSGVAVYEVIGNGQDFVFKEFNPAGEKIDHDQRERLLGKSIFEVRPGVEQFGLIEVFRRVWQTGEPAHHPVSLYQDNRLTGWYENFVYKLPSGEIVAVFENITERKQAEEALRRSEAMRDVAESVAHVGRWRWDLATRKATWSPEMYRLFEVDPARFDGDPMPVLRSRVHPDDLPGLLQTAASFLETGVPHPVEFRVVLSDGTERIVRSEAQTEYDAAGRAVAMSGYYQDVTERRRAEEALRESKHKVSEALEFNRRILDTSSIGILTYKKSGQRVSANAAAARVGGATVAQLLAQNFHEIPSWKKSGMYQAATRALDTGIEQLVEVHVVTTFGKDVWLSLSFSSFDSAGERHLLVFTSDVNERMKAQEQLQNLAKRWQATFDGVADAICLLDTEANIMQCNAAMAKLAGLHPAQCVGRIACEFIHGSKQHVEGCPFTRVRRSLRREAQELHVGNAWLQVTVDPIVGEDGLLAGMVHIVANITQHKIAEQALHESEAKFRAIVETTPDMVWEVATDGTITYASPQFEKGLGYPPAQLVGKRFLELLMPDSVDAAAKQFEDDMKGNRTIRSYEVVARHGRDGHAVHLEIDSAPALSASGEVVGFRGFARDISERVEARRARAEYQDRLRSMAMDLALGEEQERRRIAVGLHDQVGQALALACARMDLLAEAAESRGLSGQFGETLEAVRAALEATRTLTFELSPPVLYEFGLGPAVAAVAREFQQRYGIAFTVEGADECSTGPDNAAVLLYQSIREVLTNVVKHSKARNCRTVFLSEPHQLVVTVQDNGIGFDADSAFMSKDKQRGFGLFSIRERLRVLDGGLEVASHVNHGSLVRMWVPYEHPESANKEGAR